MKIFAIFLFFGLNAAHGFQYECSNVADTSIAESSSQDKEDGVFMRIKKKLGLNKKIEATSTDDIKTPSILRFYLSDDGFVIEANAGSSILESYEGNILLEKTRLGVNMWRFFPEQESNSGDAYLSVSKSYSFLGVANYQTLYKCKSKSTTISN